MENLSKKLETICLIPDVNVIVDAVAILNSHTVLNEPVELTPIINKLRTITALKNQSGHNLIEVIKLVLKMRGLQCVFSKKVVEKSGVKWTNPTIVVSILDAKEAKITIKIKIKHYD